MIIISQFFPFLPMIISSLYIQFNFLNFSFLPMIIISQFFVIDPIFDGSLIQDMANSTWALATLWHRPVPLLRAVRGRAVEQATQLAPQDGWGVGVKVKEPEIWSDIWILNDILNVMYSIYIIIYTYVYKCKYT